MYIYNMCKFRQQTIKYLLFLNLILFLSDGQSQLAIHESTSHWDPITRRTRNNNNINTKTLNNMYWWIFVEYMWQINKIPLRNDSTIQSLKNDSRWMGDSLH